MADSEVPELRNRYEVLVCTGALLFRGCVTCDFGQRLIDALNEGTRVDTPVKMTDFLPMVDVTTLGTRDAGQKFPRMYVAKSNIVYVAQVPGQGAEKGPRAYPFKEKPSVAVMVYVSRISDVQYALDGRMYVNAGEQVTGTIESEARFIPLTHVVIKPALPGEGSTYDFIALNKEHIVSVCETTAE